jgi:EmrB/QacA subfamily drug resistance transporter
MRSTYDRRWIILAVILAAECMDLLDATVVNVAAPAIHADLNTSSTALQWIVGGYALAIAVGLITGGRLGDLYGRRTMFIVGTAGFTVASLLCGIAPSTGWLIAFRLLQGLAASLMLPQGLGVIREVFPAEEISQAFGVFGPVIGLAAVFGPIVGGALVNWDLAGTSWRLVFLVNLPLGVAAVLGSLFMLPRTPATHEHSKLDVVGVVLSGTACFALVYPLIQGRALGWPWWTYFLMGVSVVLFIAFGLQQRARDRHGLDPLVLPSVFTHRGYTAGLLVMLVFFAGMGGILLTMSVFLQIGQGFSAIHAGLVFIPMSLGMAVGAGLSGAILAKKFGRLVLQAGGVVVLVGWLLIIWAVHRGGVVGALGFMPGLAVAGLGMGLTVAPLFDIVLASVSDEETGSASGLLNALQQLATAIGVAVLGSLFFASLAGHGFGGSLQRTLWVQAGSVVVMLALTPLMPRWARETDAPGGIAGAPAEALAEL